MSYVKSKQKYEEENGGAEVLIRTDYRCAARGCPNAGSIDDKCFYHWRASFHEWDQVTREIRANPAKRNHGIVQTEETVTVKDMKTRLRGNRPRGEMPLPKVREVA